MRETAGQLLSGGFLISAEGYQKLKSENWKFAAMGLVV